MSTGFVLAKPTATTGLYRGILTNTALIASPAPPTVAPLQAYVAGLVPSNQAVRFRGALFYTSIDGIRRSIDDGRTFTTVYAWTSPLQTAQVVGLNLFLCYSGGLPLLAAYWIQNAANTNHITTSSDGFIWTDGTIGATAAAAIGTFPINFNGTLYFSGSGVTAFTVDPFALTIGAITGWAASDTTRRYLVAWNGGLFAIGFNNSASNTRLWRIVGGTVSIIHSAVDTSLYSDTFSGWVDPATNDLILAIKDYVAGQPRVYRIGQPPSFTTTPITAAVVTGGGMPSSGSAIMRGVLYDQDSNPGGPPPIYVLMGSSASGSPVSAFRWNGVSTLMGDAVGGANSTGGAVDMAFPDSNIGGETFFTPRSTGEDGVPDIVNTGKGVLSTTISRRKFRLYAPRSLLLTTIGGTPATYNLNGTPLATLPAAPGYTTIMGVIGGRTYVATDLVASGVLADPTTTIGLGSNGINVNTFVGAGVLNVASTGVNSAAGPKPMFPAIGTLLVATGSGDQVVTYTGVTATSFTGCTSAGAGVMPTGGSVRGPLLPAGGSIIYGTGVMAGITGTLDANSQVVALSVAGLASNQWRVADTQNEYPGSTATRVLTLPTSGTIVGNNNQGCAATGTEQQVSVNMSGLTPGDRVAFAPGGLLDP